MNRWFAILVGIVTAVTVVGVAPDAGAVDAPIGRLGDTLRVQSGAMIADVTVSAVAPSDIPPGWGYPPRWPHQLVERGQVTVHPVQVPNPYSLSVLFQFRGVTPTGDAYEPRNTDAPDALQYSLQNAPQGSTVTGAVFWDAYRDPVSNVVLINKQNGEHLGQWNL